MSRPEILFLAAKRTPFGAFNGALKKMSATDLAVHAAQAALEQSGVPAQEVDQVIFGNVIQSSPDAIYLARHIGLRIGLPIEVPAVTVNRLCGSGFESIAAGAKEILLGDAQVVLVGGTESMSQAPHVIRGGRDGFAFGRAPQMEDSLWSALTDSYTGKPMAITAELLAQEYEISRDDCDEFALLSQQRWAEAQEAGHFEAEISPVELKGRRGSTLFSSDEHPRADSSLAGLGRLRPVFKRDGVVTAGNASGICDGAVALLLASAEYAQERGLKPLGRLLEWGVSGCDPERMGIGPVPATQRALERAKMSLSQMDLIEVNEAFAPQYLAVEKALNIPRERCNVNGGAIALGHPLAASGARIVAHLLYETARREKRYALGSACIGGGQGMSMILEILE